MAKNNAQEQAAAEQASAEQAGYRVAEGKSITTMAGIKGPGDVVEEKHVSGGEKTLIELKDKGYLV
jgi:hypothetical protein